MLSKNRKWYHDFKKAYGLKDKTLAGLQCEKLQSWFCFFKNAFISESEIYQFWWRHLIIKDAQRLYMQYP